MPSINDYPFPPEKKEIVPPIILEGVIEDISEIKQFGTNGFKRRECILKTQDVFPQHLQIEFSQERCHLLDKLLPGDKVKIEVSLRGRKWINPQGETQYFNSIQGWKIEQQCSSL